jgi:hypothetical protein
MALVITRKTRTILLIVLAVLVVGGGGFLIWRVTREETVAPEDSEAAQGCYMGSEIGGDFCGLNGNESCDSSTCYCATPHPTTGINYWKASSASKCDEPTIPPGNEPGCECCCGTDCRPGINGNCNYTEVCIPTYGPCGCYGWGDSYGDCYKVKYDGNGGTCTPSELTVQTGKPATVTVSCKRTGYKISSFTKVSGSANLNSSTGALTNVTSNVTVKANWVKEAPKVYTVTYKAGANGSISGTKVQKVNHGESTTQVQAVPNSGYHFGGWSDGRDSNPRKDTNVTKDITVTATFSLSCGDGICAADENANTCPADCDAVCGDNYCTHDENASICPDDCEAVCGDGYCTHDENAENCPDDCDANCGDGYCTGDETRLTCPTDCEAVCGDGYCTDDENAQNCPTDCDDECGDGYCTGSEDTNNCPEDCGTGVITEGPIPQTGIFDTVFARISVGLSFIFLGGLVSQYSRINYFFNSITEEHRFKQEIREQKRIAKRDAKRRKKLEENFK